MYPKYDLDLASEEYNQNSIGNSYDALKKVWPALAGEKKRGVKPGSNIKTDKTHEDWYLACGDY